jgi:hypothetical protein
VKLPFVSRLAFEIALARAERAERQVDALLDRIAHPVRDVAGGDAQPPTREPVFGPLAQAALQEMGAGLGPQLKRAMREKALANAGTMDDEQLAALIRRGEPVRWIPI